MLFASRFNLLKPPLLVLQIRLVWQLCEFQPLGWNCHPGLHEQYFRFVQQWPLKRCMHIEKAHSGFKVCQVFANTSHFCLVCSQRSPYRSERSGRKRSSSLHLSGYLTVISNSHEGTVVCKVGFEGGRGTSPFCNKLHDTRQLCLTWLWLPCHTNFQHRNAFAAFVQNRNTLVLTWWQSSFPEDISKVSPKPQQMLWIKP